MGQLLITAVISEFRAWTFSAPRRVDLLWDPRRLLSCLERGCAGANLPDPPLQGHWPYVPPPIPTDPSGSSAAPHLRGSMAGPYIWARLLILTFLSIGTDSSDWVVPWFLTWSLPGDFGFDPFWSWYGISIFYASITCSNWNMFDVLKFNVVTISLLVF